MGKLRTAKEYIMLSEAYQELKLKLKNDYKQHKGDYNTVVGITSWLEFCGIKKVTDEHISIIYWIFGAIPYVYSEKDRLEIINYLQTHKGIKYEQSTA